MTTAVETPMRKYKLLRGRHYQGAGRKPKMYLPGDIIETSVDLHEVFNDYRKEKFQLISTDGGDGLEELTVAELRKYADDGEIDLQKCVVKRDIIAAIRSARKGTMIYEAS